MGTYCSCDYIIPQQPLTVMLERGIERCGCPGLKEGQSLKINRIVLSSETSNSVKTTFYEIFLQKKQNQDNGVSYTRLVCRRSDPSNNKALIVYDDAFYHGDIVDNHAQSNNGSFYFSRKGQEDCEYIIKGAWQKDKFQKGLAIKKEKKKQWLLFQINRVEDDKAFVLFEEGEMRSYEGSVDWSMLEFKQFLTGQGKIQFKNNSVYIGGLKNGLMDTENAKKSATFMTQGETQRFEGFYKNGLREGVGTSLIKKQSMRYNYTMQWRNGVPVLESFQYNFRDPRETLLRSRGSQL